MPTGVPVRDAQQQLHAAAERILSRDGASGLTSRAVTAEAGLAKGVLHRHFDDFDAFIGHLVLARIALLDERSAELLDSAGAGSVADHLTDALVELFSPVAVAIVQLVVSRDDLRARMREAGTARIPLLGEGTEMLRAYLAAEVRRGRLPAETDADAMAPMLVGAVHLLCTDRETAPPERAAVHRIVRMVVGDA